MMYPTIFHVKMLISHDYLNYFLSTLLKQYIVVHIRTASLNHRGFSNIRLRGQFYVYEHEKMYRPCEPIIHYIKLGVRGSALHGYVSMMRRR